MRPELIIFDFDGTLADTTATILSTYRMAIKEMGAGERTDEECRATIGLPLKEGFRQLYPDFPDARLDACVNTYHTIFIENKRRLVPQLYPGVKETLEALAKLGVRMSVASSRNRESLIEFCDENDITRYFSLILGADDVARAKPDPEPVEMTMRRLGRSAGATLVVGDMPVDVAMGSGAGCRTVGVTYGNSAPQDLSDAGASFIINTFPELLTRVIYERQSPC